MGRRFLCCGELTNRCSVAEPPGSRFSKEININERKEESILGIPPEKDAEGKEQQQQQQQQKREKAG